MILLLTDDQTNWLNRQIKRIENGKQNPKLAYKSGENVFTQFVEQSVEIKEALNRASGNSNQIILSRNNARAIQLAARSTAEVLILVVVPGYQEKISEGLPVEKYLKNATAMAQSLFDLGNEIERNL